MVEIKNLIISSIIAILGVLFLFAAIVFPILILISIPLDILLKTFFSLPFEYYGVIIPLIEIAFIIPIAVCFYLILRFYRKYFFISLLIGLILGSALFLCFFPSDIDIKIIPLGEEMKSSCFGKYIEDYSKIVSSGGTLFVVDGLPLENSTVCSAPECIDYFGNMGAPMRDNEGDQCYTFCEETTLKCK